LKTENWTALGISTVIHTLSIALTKQRKMNKSSNLTPDFISYSFFIIIVIVIVIIRFIECSALDSHSRYWAKIIQRVIANWKKDFFCNSNSLTFIKISSKIINNFKIARTL
jgi:hypothetical protein